MDNSNIDYSKLTLDEVKHLLCRGRVAFGHRSTVVEACPVCAGLVSFEHLAKRQIARRDRHEEPLQVKPKRSKPTSQSKTKKGKPAPVQQGPSKNGKTARRKVLELIWRMPYSKTKLDAKGKAPGSQKFFWDQGKLPSTVNRYLTRLRWSGDVSEDVMTFIIQLLRFHHPDPTIGLQRDLKGLMDLRIHSEVLLLSKNTVYDGDAPSYTPVGFKGTNRTPFPLRLQGSLVKQFLKAKYRGYLGTASHWLRRSKTARLSDGWSSEISLWRSNPLMCWSDQRRSICGDEPQKEAVNLSGFSLHLHEHSKSEHERNRSSCTLLARSSWPEERYPSSPTLLEWEMRRLEGKPLQAPHYGAHPSVRVTPSQFWKIPGLARRTVSNLIIGIRSDVKVPESLIHHFRYRWNFLILATAFPPPDLVSFLISLWRKKRTALWMRYISTFRRFLKEVSTQWVTPHNL